MSAVAQSTPPPRLMLRSDAAAGTKNLVDGQIEQIQANVPECLRERHQWVCWKFAKRKGKLTKLPVNPATGKLADTSNPSSWGSFEQACDCWRRHRRLAGIGYVFGAIDPYSGVDLDDSIDPGSGELKPWARAFCDSLASYTEVSPSLTGVKIFLRGTKPGERCRRKHEDGEVEIYSSERFFTTTGRRLESYPSGVEDRQEQLAAVYQSVFGSQDREPDRPQAPPAPAACANGLLADDEIVRLATCRRTGPKFLSLWTGQWQGHFRSQSEADSSLVFTLAYYTKDPVQIDRMFRTSGLMREKWDEQHGQQTYGEMTISKALEKVTNQYQPKRDKSQSAQRPSTPAEKPGLPGIITCDVQLADLTDQAIAALKQANSPPSIFVRAGMPARVVQDEEGIPRIERLDRAKVRARLAEVANFFSLRKGHDGYVRVGVSPPLSLAENILALGRWDFPPLIGVARSPILRQDGSICTTPGYDWQSRLVYCPDAGLIIPEIPEQPTSHEIEACADILQGLVGDFPFADQASKANALAILFSVLMRPVIAGHVPLAIVDAPTQGTGKTLLVTILMLIAVGSVASESIPSKQNEDEWRKKITSILLNAWPFVLLDNIPDNTTIDSPALAAALTTHEWSDRLLGKNETVRLPSRAVWVATGNNLRVAGDMPRRSYSIRLDANAERPWERSGFKIPDLEEHVLRHRGDLLSAAFTLIRGWHAAGRPKAKVPTFGSFEQWTATIGGVLAFAGIGGFLANLSATRAVQDEDAAQWSGFFDAWWDTFGERVVTVGDVCEQIVNEARCKQGILPSVLLVNRDKGEGSLRRSLGRSLSRLSDRIFSGHKLLPAGEDTHRKVCNWHLKAWPPQSVTPLTPHNPAANPAEGGEQ